MEKCEDCHGRLEIAGTEYKTGKTVYRCSVCSLIYVEEPIIPDGVDDSFQEQNKEEIQEVLDARAK